MSSAVLFGNIVGSLGNKDMDIFGFFFKSSKSIYFSVVSNENNFSVWEYYNDRTYKPIHNAKAFDGYKSAEDIFDSIVIDKNYKSVHLTSCIVPPYNKTQTLSKNKVKYYQNLLQEKGA